MATLTIRNLPENIHQGLRARAATNGRSMEAEARMTLAHSVELSPVNEVVPERVKPNWPELHARARKIMIAANGGVMPTNVVDEILAERRITAAKEQADYDRLAGISREP